jgi:RHS repeat-associated protein
MTLTAICAICCPWSRFTGKERDTESGNDYFEARYYASSTGRMISPDPSGLYYADPSNPQSLNLYSYVLNNPLTYTDPSGEECVWDDGSFDSGGWPTLKPTKDAGVPHPKFFGISTFQKKWVPHSSASFCGRVG